MFHQNGTSPQSISEQLKEIILQLKQNEDVVDAGEQNGSIKTTLEDMVGKYGVSLLNRSLDLLLKKIEDEEDNEWTQREWKALSSALDSLFLRILSAFTFILCVVYILHALLCEGHFIHHH